MGSGRGFKPLRGRRMRKFRNAIIKKQREGGEERDFRHGGKGNWE